MEFQNKMLTRAAAIKRYGAIDMAKGIWPNANKWLALLELPTDLGLQWKFGGKLVTHINCNKDIHGPLLGALEDLKLHGLISELKTFDGCFNIRAVRGTTASVSAHSYGLAIDLNASTNQLGLEHSPLSHGLVKCFIDRGFDSGIYFHARKDPMHFSYCWEGNEEQAAARKAA